MKVKEFIKGLNSLESDINSWLEENKENIIINDIKYSVLKNEGKYVTAALVMYTEKLRFSLEDIKEKLEELTKRVQDCELSISLSKKDQKQIFTIKDFDDEKDSDYPRFEGLLYKELQKLNKKVSKNIGDASKNNLDANKVRGKRATLNIYDDACDCFDVDKIKDGIHISSEVANIQYRGEKNE